MGNIQDLSKLFVLVPGSIKNFDGATISAIASNTKKIYFEVDKQILWNNGVKYGLTKAEGTALSTLIDTDTNMSVRAIAQDVVNNIIDWQSADANEVIDTLKEVLNWFNNLPEGDAGALELVNKVGSPKVLYTDADEASAAGKQVGDVKTAATGLYKLIEDSVAGKNVDADAKFGEELIDASASNNKVEVESTQKLKDAVHAAEESLQGFSVAGVNATINDSQGVNSYTGSISKSDLQNALFSYHTSYTHWGSSSYGTVAYITEQNGELKGITLNDDNLANRIINLENIDPWETYSAS